MSIQTQQKQRRSSIDPSTLQPMYKFESSPGPKFNLLFIGAGNINFGSPEGPWNHSKRVEMKFGTRLNVVGIVDPNGAKAELELKKKRESFVATAYAKTKLFNNVEEAKEGFTSDDVPHAIIVGAPPQFRGGLKPPADLELSLLKNFPTSAFFLEKPVTIGPSDQAKEVGKIIAQTGNVVSVGYMLRYSRAVQSMVKFIEDNNLTVMCTSAR